MKKTVGTMLGLINEAIILELPSQADIEHISLMPHDELRLKIRELFLPTSSRKRKEDILVFLDKEVYVPPLIDEMLKPGATMFQQSQKVKYWLGHGFRSFLNSTPSFDMIGGPTKLRSFTISEGYKISDLELQSVVEAPDTCLSTDEQIIWRFKWLTEQQPKGEDGILPTNDKFQVVIGVSLKNGKYVYAEWKHSKQAWFCDAGSYRDVNAVCDPGQRHRTQFLCVTD